MIIIDPPPSRMGVTRIVIGAVGLGLMAMGAVALLAGVPIHRYPGVVLWLAGAIVIHDGIIGPIVVALVLFGRRIAGVTGRVPALVGRVALIVAVMTTFATIPAVVIHQRGNTNPTVDFSPYPLILAIIWAVAIIVAIVMALIGIVLQARRRRADGPSAPAGPASAETVSAGPASAGVAVE